MPSPHLLSPQLMHHTRRLRRESHETTVRPGLQVEDASRPRLAVTICISGWLTEDSGFIEPWKNVGGDDAERLAVCWEGRQLRRLGTALKDFMAEAGTVEMVKMGIMHSALQGLLSAVALPATLLTATSFIDNAWSTATDRADQAAMLLADALYDSAWYGHRPVTLIGFSLGARVIFGCVENLPWFQLYTVRQLGAVSRSHRCDENSCESKADQQRENRVLFLLVEGPWRSSRCAAP